MSLKLRLRSRRHPQSMRVGKKKFSLNRCSISHLLLSNKQSKFTYTHSICSKSSTKRRKKKRRNVGGSRAKRGFMGGGGGGEFVGEKVVIGGMGAAQFVGKL